ncbi:MAG: DinB family protein [Ignavibacteriales bacterium]|nr:MAG: DinB family protein [Ignavibacteriales bacterium]
MSNNHSALLLNKINDNLGHLKSLTEEEFNSCPDGMDWTRKEILGHLIDSASNNHHRFIKIQFEELPYRIISYQQDEWVATNHYKDENKDDLVSLWYAYNTHLVHVIKNIPQNHLPNKCLLKDDSIVTLEFLVKDYIEHMIHHLEQIFSSSSTK